MRYFMKKRRGFALPLVVTIFAFIVLLGGLAISVANSTHKISYGNIQKTQAFYLAKAGTEIGYGFLDSPIDPALSVDSGGRTWFDLSDAINASNSISNIKAEFDSKVGTKIQSYDVFIEKSGTTESLVFKPSVPSPVDVGNQHYYGTVGITISLVPAVAGTPLEKNTAVYQITSNATLKNANAVNSTHKMTLTVRAANKFDKKYE